MTAAADLSVLALLRDVGLEPAPPKPKPEPPRLHVGEYAVEVRLADRTVARAYLTPWGWHVPLSRRVRDGGRDWCTFPDRACAVAFLSARTQAVPA